LRLFGEIAAHKPQTMIGWGWMDGQRHRFSPVQADTDEAQGAG
jgi:hypothetical protein